MPAAAPPIAPAAAAPAQRRAICARTEESRSRIRASTAFPASASERSGTSPAVGTFQRASRMRATADAWPGVDVIRAMASAVPIWCSRSARSRASSSPPVAATATNRSTSEPMVSVGDSTATGCAALKDSTTRRTGASSGSSDTSLQTNWYPCRATVRMKRGSLESSPSARRSVRTACDSAPSDTITSLQTSAKITCFDTASSRRRISRCRRSKYFGISATGVPLRSRSRWRGESTNSANRKRTGSLNSEQFNCRMDGLQDGRIASNALYFRVFLFCNSAILPFCNPLVPPFCNLKRTCDPSTAIPAAYARRCSSVHGGPAGRPLRLTNSSALSIVTASAHLYVELELPRGAADGELIQHPVCGAHQTIGLAHRGVRIGKLVKWRPPDRESDDGLGGSEFGHEPLQRVRG